MGRSLIETVEKCSFLFKFKEGKNFNQRNTSSISRIKLKLHFVHNVEADAGIGLKGAFCEGLVKGGKPEDLPEQKAPPPRIWGMW